MNRTFVAGLIAVGVIAGEAVAQKALPTVEQQIAAAVLALPMDLRAGATVMGYKTPGKLETLRAGTNGMNCLALFAVEKAFHIACYHNGMEPFMARGRELREQGVTGGQVDTVRYREVREGKLKMPVQAAMYQLFGSDSSWNATTNALTGARSLLVVYIPGATPESTGLSPVPAKPGSPWIMFPGTPKAHIMLQGSM